MKHLWVATHNQGKAKEIKAILQDFEIKTLRDLPNFPPIDENGSTYAENAQIKAKALYELVKEPVLADDTGLEVKALKGLPGLHTARYAGADSNHEKNIDKLLLEMQNIPDGQRHARFVCDLVYINKDGEPKLFTGICNGRIIRERKGKGGFGYDPVFAPDGYDLTLAEMPASEKNALSHRYSALQKLNQYLAANTCL